MPTKRNYNLNALATLFLCAAPALIFCKQTFDSHSNSFQPQLILQTTFNSAVPVSAFARDGRWLAVSDGYTIDILEMPSARTLRTLTSNDQSKILSLATSPDGRWLAAAHAGRGSTPDGASQVELASGVILGVATNGTDAKGNAIKGQVVSGGAVPVNEGTIEQWEIETGDLSFSFAARAEGRHLITKLQNGTVQQDPMMRGIGGKHPLSYSPDSKILAAGWGESVLLLDTSTGKLIRGLESGVPTQLSFSHEGRFLAATMDSGAVLWEAATGTWLARLEQERKLCSAAAFNDDATLVATGTADGLVRVWQVKGGHSIGPTYRMKGSVEYVRFVQGENALAAIGPEEIKEWNLGTHTEVLSVGLKGEAPLAKAAGQNMNKELADGSKLRGWAREDLEGPERRIYTNEKQGFAAWALSEGNMNLARVGNDGSITIFALPSGNILHSISKPSSVMKSTALATNGRFFVTGDTAGSIKVWDLKAGQLVRHFIGNPGGVDSVALSPDGTLLATAGADNAVRVWNLNNGSEVRRLTSKSRIYNVCFSPDGAWLSVGAGLWSTSKPDDFPELQHHSKYFIMASAFSPDGSLLATGDDDGLIQIWDMKSQRKVQEFKSDLLHLRALAFSPDGGWLASAGAGGDPKLWDAKTWTLSRSFLGHMGTVESLAFTPDGRSLVTGGFDRTVRTWDVLSGKQRLVVNGNSNWVRSLQITMDGRLIFSGSGDGAVHILKTDSGELQATLVTPGTGGDWLAISPQGDFDGSPDSWNHIGWRFSKNLYDVMPVEAFFQDYFHPGLLSAIIRGEKTNASHSLMDLDRRQPQVQLTLASTSHQPGAEITDRTVKLKVSAMQAPADERHTGGSGVQDVRVFRNGSLIKVWRGKLPLSPPGTLEFETDAPISAGQNRYTAYAFSAADIKSPNAELDLVGSEALKRIGTIYLISIGINKYQDGSFDLAYAEADAAGIAQDFVAEQKRLNATTTFRRARIFDGAATKQNILGLLEHLGGADAVAPQGVDFGAFKATEVEDTVIVFFAGHGIAYGPHYYLVPYDLGFLGNRDALDEVGLRKIIEHSISEEELQKAFEGIKAARLILIIDACNSGQLLETEEQRLGPMNSKGLAQLAWEKGMYIIAASQSYQASLEASQFSHGLLTYALLEALKTDKADIDPKDGQVTLKEWLDYGARRVPELQLEMMKASDSRGRTLRFLEHATATIDGMQTPRVFYRREVDAEPFVIARPVARSAPSP